MQTSICSELLLSCMSCPSTPYQYVCLCAAELPSHLHHLEAVASGLSGRLPQLPRGMKRLDLSDNALSGSLEDIDTSHMEVST